ncbi:hypothetical protein [Streptomyces sp. SP18BB07]|uniref:hypothetical protein n=1 Tax=Streptomyces sp. SP18BB07 TaxID=3002522 RepID=UPI002E75AB80|nr:hypothetical protein [Streptomyces sp. SP18BB07]MEE1764398.1 hypothetical protein [Streptomyces sp. SP18BB07]
MITTSSLVRPMQPPRRRSGQVRIASIDAEWTKNYRIKNGNKPFCFSITWLDLPSDTPADVTTVPFEYTAVYVDDPGEMDALVTLAAQTVETAAESADFITGHQFCSDLAVLAANAPDGALPALTYARAQWMQRRQDSDEDTARYLDTRYDAGHILTGTSRRLVDVCTELGLDVTQPELRSASMPALHRRWTEDGDAEGRERVSVLNLRHSLSTAYVAARTAGVGHWPADGFNVNRALAEHAQGAWSWLEHPTFTRLLEDPCPSESAPLSPSKAPRQPARRRSSTR